MKKEKLTAALYCFASMCFFIGAIIGFTNDNSMATVWLCLGAAMLCLGSVSLSKIRNSKKDNEDKNDKE